MKCHSKAFTTVVVFLYLFFSFGPTSHVKKTGIPLFFYPTFIFFFFPSPNATSSPAHVAAVALVGERDLPLVPPPPLLLCDPVIGTPFLRANPSATATLAPLSSSGDLSASPGQI